MLKMGMVVYVHLGLRMSCAMPHCMQVISIDGFARRNRFILAVSLGLGLGVTLVPGWAEVRVWRLPC